MLLFAICIERLGFVPSVFIAVLVASFAKSNYGLVPQISTAAIGSFFAGCVATALIGLFAPPLAQLAFQFGLAEYFSFMVCGLIVSIVLANGSVLKVVGMMVLGLLLGIVGTDGQTGMQRFTFGIP